MKIVYDFKIQTENKIFKNSRVDGLISTISMKIKEQLQRS